MAKLVSHEDGVLTSEVLRRWTCKEHEVALMRLTHRDTPEDASTHLLCECDFSKGPRVHGGPGDPHACEAKKVIRNVLIMEARRAHADAWKGMGLKEAILDIKRRVEADEQLGQHLSRCVYTQEVARLLGHDDDRDVLAACGELYAEERLDLNGRILADFVPGFRFPTDMRAIMRYVVEEPLGWPNGDAGECFLAGFEAGVQERTGHVSGKAAFGPHWPGIDPALLAEYGLEPAAATLRMMAPLVGPEDWKDGGEKAAEEAVTEAWQVTDALRRLSLVLPSAVDGFREFIRGLLMISLVRVELDLELRTVKVPPSQTLTEMAESFERLAAHCRSKTQP